MNSLLQISQMKMCLESVPPPAAEGKSIYSSGCKKWLLVLIVCFFNYSLREKEVH